MCQTRGNSLNVLSISQDLISYCNSFNLEVRKYIYNKKIVLINCEVTVVSLWSTVMWQLYRFDQLWCDSCTLWSTVMLQLHCCDQLWYDSCYITFYCDVIVLSLQKLVTIIIQIIETKLLSAVLIKCKNQCG